MTGFGKSEATLQNKKISVEIRSLNSKQLDLGLRLPAVYRQSEYEIRNVIARTIGARSTFSSTSSPRPSKRRPASTARYSANTSAR